MLLYISRTDRLHVQQGPFAAALGVARTFQSRRTSSAAPHNFALWSNHMSLALSFAARWLSGGTG